jgi:DNA-binding Lrp family transcriptional regulator
VVKDDHPRFPLRAPARAHRAVRSVPAQAQPGCGPVEAIARVRLAPYRSREAFERDLGTIPAVRSAMRIVGDVDYELRLRCRDLADLAAVLTSLRRVQGIEIASTSLVLGEVKGLGRAALSTPDIRRAPRPRETRSA